jgi:hypothetical protein
MGYYQEANEMEITDWLIVIAIVVGLFILKIYYPQFYAPLDRAATTGAQSVFSWFSGLVSHNPTLLNITGGG